MSAISVTIGNYANVYVGIVNPFVVSKKKIVTGFEIVVPRAKCRGFIRRRRASKQSRRKLVYRKVVRES